MPQPDRPDRSDVHERSPSGYGGATGIKDRTAQPSASVEGKQWTPNVSGTDFQTGAPLRLTMTCVQNMNKAERRQVSLQPTQDVGNQNAGAGLWDDAPDGYLSLRDISDRAADFFQQGQAYAITIEPLNTLTSSGTGAGT